MFGLCAAVPVVALLAINSAFGTGSAQAQMNLGHAVGIDFSPQLAARVWWNFTDLGFYDYHWFSHWVYALWPAAVVVVGMCIRPAREALRSFAATPAVRLSAFVAAVMFGMLIGVTALFGDKFDYVGLERYYLPVRPLYFLLFVAPIALSRWRVVRAAACVGLLVACSWLVQQEWGRPYKRWLAANRPTTPYGRWSRCFEPGASDLYDWLRSQAAPNLILVSNFHEYLALETKVPTLPIPSDPNTLNDWIERISTSRGITDPRVLFVLDPDNKWRDHWIPNPANIVRTFDLGSPTIVRPGTASQVFEYLTDGEASRS